MKTLDRGQDKIQQICKVLRQETLEPAKMEAERILEEATAKAKHIKQEAQLEAERIIADAQTKMEQERNVFQSSLDQAARQSIEVLKQSVDTQFFNQELDSLLVGKLTEPDTVAKMINAVVSAIEKDGIETDIEVAISKAVSADKVASLLTQKVKQRLSKGEIQLGHFAGGATVKLVDQKMTIEVTEESLKEVFARYVRKDFRKILFGKNG